MGKIIRKTKNSDYLYSYHILDARKIDAIIKNKIIDVIITSPPYSDIKDYKSDKQIGFNQKYSDYLNDLEKIFNYCEKIVKDTGSMWIVIDTYKEKGKVKLLPFDLVDRIQKKWNLQDIIIWNKDKTLPWVSKGRLRNIFEYILFFTKNKSTNFKYHIDRIKIPTNLKKWWVTYPERYHPKGKTPTRMWEFNYPDSDIWKIPIPSQGTWGNGWVKHYCPFPPKLVETIIQLTTDEGDVVLDPFAGSGSVLAQARVMKRMAIGLDVNESFRDMYNNNVYPEIKKLWNNRVKELKQIENMQNYLDKTIRNLRKLKYPKDMIIRSIKAGGSENIINNLNSIFVLNNKDEKIGSDIFLVFEDLPPKKEMITQLWDVCNKAPLSIYGIKPQINMVSKRDIIKNRKILNIPDKLNLYAKGKTHYVEKTTSFNNWIKDSSKDDWIDNFKDFLPPILSNIEVKERIREIQQDSLNDY